MENYYGPLAIDNMGLTLSVIQSMAHHSDLAKLCAFDTFINNPDRSPPNLFFNEATDSYQGIDHFSAFSQYNLASYAQLQLSKLQNYPFSKEEVEGLIIYLETLKLLSTKFSSQEIYRRLLINLNEAHQEVADLSDDIRTRLKYYEESINKNYQDTENLILHLVSFVFEKNKKLRAIVPS